MIRTSPKPHNLKPCYRFALSRAPRLRARFVSETSRQSRERRRNAVARSRVVRDLGSACHDPIDLFELARLDDLAESLLQSAPSGGDAAGSLKRLLADYRRVRAEFEPIHRAERSGGLVLIWAPPDGVSRPQLLDRRGVPLPRSGDGPWFEPRLAVLEDEMVDEIDPAD